MVKGVGLKQGDSIPDLVSGAHLSAILACNRTPCAHGVAQIQLPAPAWDSASNPFPSLFLLAAHVSLQGPPELGLVLSVWVTPISLLNLVGLQLPVLE